MTRTMKLLTIGILTCVLVLVAVRIVKAVTAPPPARFEIHLIGACETAARGRLPLFWPAAGVGGVDTNFQAKKLANQQNQGTGKKFLASGGRG